MEGGMVSRSAQIKNRELLIRAFRFLKADDVRLGGRQPGNQPLLSPAERIDVPGDDAHSLVAAVYDRRRLVLKVRNSAVIDRRYSSNSTPGFGTITSDPG